MNADEIIEQIKALPPEERQKVIEFVHALAQPAKIDRQGVSEDFARLVDKVFAENHELLRKLAE